MVLVPWLLGWEAPPDLTFIVAAHWGTMVAVLAYFWSDWAGLLNGGLAWLRERRTPPSPEGRFLFLLIIGTVPAVIVGLLFYDAISVMAERPVLVAVLLLVTALVLLVGYLAKRPGHSMQELNWKDGLFIGLAQVLAIFPGISRSGVTIVAGRLQGLDSEAAARFSFMLSAPVIFAAGMHSLVDLFHGGDWVLRLPVLAAGFLSAAAVGYASIHWLLGFLKRRSTLLFAVYCVLMGGAGLAAAILRGG